MTPDYQATFSRRRPQYEKFTAKLHALITELLTAKNIEAVIDSRTKSVESFNEKTTREGKKYDNPLRDITDLCGIRVVLRTSSDINLVRTLVEREFLVDNKMSVRKSEHLADDQFGYLSEHYIVQIKSPRTQLGEWHDFSDMRAEIQVRTILQHAWAAVQHSLDYKSRYDIPSRLRRRLYRLCALFELADQELDQITIEARELAAQYAEQAKSSIGVTELNVDSLRAYLEKSETVAQWARKIESMGVAVGGIGMISRDVEMARMAGIFTIQEVNAVLKGAGRWGDLYLKDFFHNTFGNPIPAGKCSMDRNGIVTIFLIACYLEIFTHEVLEQKLGWGSPERAITPARKYNPDENAA